MRRNVLLLTALTLATLTGCQDQPTQPTGVLPEAAFAKGGNAACPLVADIVVGTEVDLVAALATAGPGDVIGIDGMIPMTDLIEILAEGVTLTCATAGSGFTVAGVYDFMVNVGAPSVTLDRLIFDGTDAGRAAVVVYAEGLIFSGNIVYAGPQMGAFLIDGSDRATVADNHFIATIPTNSGVHIQGALVGLTVTGNTAEALVPSQHILFGGIRVHNATAAVIDDNVVVGPWANGLSLTLLQGSQIEGNYADGAVNFGMAFSFNSGGQEMRDNVIRNNRFTGSGTPESVPLFGLPPAGMMIRQACSNAFLGNNLNGNMDDVGAVFMEDTGANTLVGNKNVIFDDGNWDCDDDGVADPNHFSGSGKTFKGGFGRVISEATAWPGEVM